MERGINYMITPNQFRMARAILNLTTRELGKELNLSAMAVSRFENGDESVISLSTARKAKNYFEERKIFFGPCDGVSVGQNVFYQERWFSTACLKLLQESGITPSSSDLIAAYKRCSDDGR